MSGAEPPNDSPVCGREGDTPCTSSLFYDPHRCIHPAGHEDPHRCLCGERWSYRVEAARGARMRRMSGGRCDYELAPDWSPPGLVGVEDPDPDTTAREDALWRDDEAHHDEWRYGG